MSDIELPDHAVLQSSRSLIKGCYLSAITDSPPPASAASYCVHSQFVAQKHKTSRVMMQK